jgi:hypothetical protein
LELERELVAAYADAVTVGEGGAGMKSPALHRHAVERSQIGNHETASGINDYGVMPTDLVIVENDVIVGESPYPSGRRL